MKIKNVKMIEVSDWDKLVSDTYKRPYNFQQQDGCQRRGTFNITIPSESQDDEMHDSIIEEINSGKMGVKFQVWLDRDPKQSVGEYDWTTELFWERNFYPDIHTVANDLHKKGLIEQGSYIINIDW